MYRGLDPEERRVAQLFVECENLYSVMSGDPQMAQYLAHTDVCQKIEQIRKNPRASTRFVN